MRLSFLTLCSFATSSIAEALEHGSEYANSMGEIAMLYPSDREWSEEAETTAPCGSYSDIQNRTEFPLDNGFVALVAKSMKAWSVSLKISYKKDPTENSDFDEWANGNVTNEISIGHTCFYMPDQPSSVNSGDVATIQLEYMAIEDENDNETHYACADIKFVEDSVFKVTEEALSCFNATDNDYYSYSDYGESTVQAEGTADSTASQTTKSTSTSSTTTKSSSSSAAAISLGENSSSFLVPLIAAVFAAFGIF